MRFYADLRSRTGPECQTRILNDGFGCSNGILKELCSKILAKQRVTFYEIKVKLLNKSKRQMGSTRPTTMMLQKDSISSGIGHSGCLK